MEGCLDLVFGGDLFGQFVNVHHGYTHGISRQEAWSCISYSVHADVHVVIVYRIALL